VSSIMGGSSLLMGSSLIDMEEETGLEESHKKELEEIIKDVPYNLVVALIKISILHNYEPLDIETLYQKVSPAFSLLRRNDGSKYVTQTVTTVRSAMVSNKLYTKNAQNKYVLNVNQALKILKGIKNRKRLTPDARQIMIENKSKVEEKENTNTTNMNINNMMNMSSFINYDSPSSEPNVVGPGGKRKVKKVKKGKEGVKQRIEKFEKTFLVLKNLLKVSSNDKILYSQLSFDFANIADPSKFGENKLNVDKIIGMLSVFKFFKPFIERCFSSIECQENLMIKINELNGEVHYMDTLFRFKPEEL